MIKRFLRVFICLSILLVIAFQQASCSFVNDIFERQHQENEKQALFCEQYMQSIPVDEEGYTMTNEKGVDIQWFINTKEIVWEIDGQQAVLFRSEKKPLTLRYKETDYEFDENFLAKRSEKYCKIFSVWQEYYKTPIEEREEKRHNYSYVGVYEDDLYFVVGYRYAQLAPRVCPSVPPSLYKFDVRENKILYLGFFPSYYYSGFDNLPQIIVNR